MSRTIRKAAAPLVPAASAAARSRLPSEGGLNEIVADRHTIISVLTGARTAGVRLRRPRKDAASYQTNRGFIYHPTRAAIRDDLPRTDPDYWIKPAQRIPQAAGWWDDTMREGSAAVTPAIIRAMNETARYVQYGG